MQFTSLLALAASISSVAAQYKGFNYGSTFTDGSAKQLADFTAEFNAAKMLPGTSGFTSARLYTMIQAGTTNTPIAAIQAAIDTDTSLLLGLWASGGQTGLTNEIAALKAAITQYGTAFTSRVVGISVGSEDLYRVSVIGIASMAGIGAGPDVVVNFINQVKSAISGTALSGAKITHVDTFNSWTNGTNAAVIDAVDFLSMDAYPYFQLQMANSIDNGASLFKTAYQETVAVSKGKDVWITETGWPVSGPVSGAAIANTANAKTFWDQVGCNFAFGKINTYWYILQDAQPTTPSPSFGLVGAGPVSGTPLYDLTCPLVSASSSPASSAAASATVDAQRNVLVGASSSAPVSSPARTSSSAAVVAPVAVIPTPSSSPSSTLSSSSPSFSTSSSTSAGRQALSTASQVVSSSATSLRAATTLAAGTTTNAASAQTTSSNVLPASSSPVSALPPSRSESSLIGSSLALVFLIAGIAAVL